MPPEIIRDPSQLWSIGDNSGMTRDPRRVRTGGTYMPPSALSGGFTILRRKTVIRDQYLGTLPADQFSIQFSYIDWPGLNQQIESEGTRYEAVGSWQRSHLEHKRQLFKMAALRGPAKDILDEARNLWLEKKSELVKLFISILDFISKYGDWSYEQFEHYARRHKDSGLGYRRQTWAALLRDESKMKEAYSQFYKVVRELTTILAQDKYYKGDLTIDPKWTYPAVRSRPGDVQDANIEHGNGQVLLSKYRDRAAGGVYGLSQLFWPIDRPDLKKQLATQLLRAVESLLSLRFITPEVEGVKAYIQFFEEDPHKLRIFDTAMAERVEAQISDFPTASNLSAQGFDKRLGQKKFSGMSLTRTDQYLTEPFLIVAAIKLGYISKASHYYFGGDNWAVVLEEELPQEIESILSPSQRWLGHNPLSQSIGGAKFVIDNSDKAENWTERQYRFGILQHKSGLVRLTKSLVNLNLVPDIMTLDQFLRKVSDTAIDTIELHEEQPYHHYLDDPAIALQLLEQIPELGIACEAILKISQQLSIPYKLIDDVKTPTKPTIQKVV
jgi:hypothetical protein